MTLDEARRVAKIIGTADGGCSVCVGNLVDKMNSEFPEFEWTDGERGQDDEDGESFRAVDVKPRAA